MNERWRRGPASVLLVMQTLGSLAGVAAETSTESLSELQNRSPVLHAGAALLLLLVAATLSVYKPRGMTRYGQRKQEHQRSALAAPAPPTRGRPRPNGPS